MQCLCIFRSYLDVEFSNKKNLKILSFIRNNEKFFANVDGTTLSINKHGPIKITQNNITYDK